MFSATAIANLALSKLGDEGEISSLDEDSRAARAVNGCFAMMRDAVLRDHPWNFATRRAQLAALAELPTGHWGDGSLFPLPADFIRLLSIEGDLPWQLEGRNLLVNTTAALKIRYTARITDTGEFDPLFAEALACRIAMQIAQRITGSTNAVVEATEQYRKALLAAKRVDGQDNPPDEFPETSWVLSRESEGYGPPLDGGL